jgi:hypothetical protein
MALTGSALLAHHSNFDRTAAERVTSAGYFRADGIKPSYTQYYIQKMRAELQRSAILSYGRKIDMETVESIRNHKEYKNTNTRVEVDYKNCITSVYLYNNLIAKLSDSRIIVYSGGFRTKTTKSRLNRILMHFCGLKLYQKNHTWYVVFPGEDVPFEEGMVFDMI